MQSRSGSLLGGIGSIGAAILLGLAIAGPAGADPSLAPDSLPRPVDSSAYADLPEPAESPGNPAPPPSDAAIAANLMISPAAASRARRAECEAARSQGEMVVCGFDRGEQWRVPSTADSDPASRQGQANGVPRAPNVSSLPDCSRGCIGFGKVPPPVYVVDFSKLPEAPKGSDADRIAKGEMPAP